MMEKAWDREQVFLRGPMMRFRVRVKCDAWCWIVGVRAQKREREREMTMGLQLWFGDDRSGKIRGR